MSSPRTTQDRGAQVQQMCLGEAVGCWSQVRPACVRPGCTCCLLGLCPQWGCYTLVAYRKGVPQELQVCPQAAAAVGQGLGRSPSLPWRGPLGASSTAAPSAPPGFVAESQVPEPRLARSWRLIDLHGCCWASVLVRVRRDAYRCHTLSLPSWGLLAPRPLPCLS